MAVTVVIECRQPQVADERKDEDAEDRGQADFRTASVAHEPQTNGDDTQAREPGVENLEEQGLPTDGPEVTRDGVIPALLGQLKESLAVKGRSLRHLGLQPPPRRVTRA